MVVSGDGSWECIIRAPVLAHGRIGWSYSCLFINRFAVKNARTGWVIKILRQ